MITASGGGGGGQAAAMAAAAATAGLFAAIACAEGFTRLAGEEQAGGEPPRARLGCLSVKDWLVLPPSPLSALSPPLALAFPLPPTLLGEVAEARILQEFMSQRTDPSPLPLAPQPWPPLSLNR